jgi:hypothetical protein
VTRLLREHPLIEVELDLRNIGGAESLPRGFQRVPSNWQQIDREGAGIVRLRFAAQARLKVDGFHMRTGNYRFAAVGHESVYARGLRPARQ